MPLNEIHKFVVPLSVLPKLRVSWAHELEDSKVLTGLRCHKVELRTGQAIRDLRGTPGNKGATERVSPKI